MACSTYLELVVIGRENGSVVRCVATPTVYGAEELGVGFGSNVHEICLWTLLTAIAHEQEGETGAGSGARGDAPVIQNTSIASGVDSGFINGWASSASLSNT